MIVKSQLYINESLLDPEPCVYSAGSHNHGEILGSIFSSSSSLSMASHPEAMSDEEVTCSLEVACFV